MTSRRQVIAGVAVGAALAAASTEKAGAQADGRSPIRWLADLAVAKRSDVERSVNSLVLAGYGSDGDGGGAVYVRRVGPRSDLPVAFVSADGATWTWDPTQPIRVTMFGADSRGQRPTAADIQSAVDFCIRAELQQCWVPEGLYLIEDTIHLGYGETVHSVSLVGECERGAYGGHMAGVRFHHLVGDRPLINIQAGRNSTVRGIGFRGYGGAKGEASYIEERISGVLFNPASYNVSPDAADWLDVKRLPHGLDRYRPYAAVTVDAYSGERPNPSYPDVTYPEWTKLTKQWGKGFTSAFTLRDCSFRGFAAVLATAPSGSDGNGDFVNVQDCDWEFCVYGITINHTQARNSDIRNCRYSYCHTAISNRAFGRRNGKIGGPIDNLSGGQGYQIFDLGCGGGNGTMVLRNCYAEGFVRIGRWGHGLASFLNGIRFEGCEFGFNHRGPKFGGPARSPAWLLQCDSPVTPVFVNCIMGVQRFVMLAGPSNRGVVVENLVAVAGRDYFEKSHGASMSEGIAEAYASTGGVFVGASSAGGAVDLRGTLEVTYFDRRAPWQWQSQRLCSQVQPGVLPHGEMCAHAFARSVVDLDGQEWPIVVRSAVTTLSSNYWVRLPAISGMILTGILRRDVVRRLEIEEMPEPGDLLYEDATENLYAITEATAANDGTVEITAELQNNFVYGGTDFGSPRFIVPFAGKGSCKLIKAPPLISQTIWWGDFTAGKREIANIHRGDGYGGNCGGERELKLGMRVMLDARHSSGAILAGKRHRLARLVGVESGKKGGAGRAEMDRPAQATGRFPICAVLLAATTVAS